MSTIDTVSSYSLNSAIYNYNSGNITLSGSKKSDSKESKENEQEIQELSRRDRAVRAHEAAHTAAGGQYINGAASFQYEKGADGKMYAVGGEVSIDTSPVSDNPQATIAKMQTVRRAALAPADPSGQDRSVAAAASAAEFKARQELAEENSSTGDAKKSSAGFSGPIGSQKTSTYNQKGIASSDDSGSADFLAIA